MNGWIFFALYVVGGLYTGRKAVAAAIDDNWRQVARGGSRDIWLSNDWADKMLYGLIGLMAALLWPLALPFAVLLFSPKPGKYQREVELRDAQRRIEELERELDIRRYEP